MSDYTPTEEEMRGAWFYKRHVNGHEDTADEEFDRFISRIEAEAWENGLLAQRAYDRQLIRWGKGQGGGGPFAAPVEPRNPHTEQ